MSDFDWIPFYTEFADKLLAYKNNRAELLRKLEKAFQSVEGLEYPFIKLDDICPFTVFGCFNKGITDENRIATIRELKKVFQVNAELPSDFKGIPILNLMMTRLFDNKSEHVTDYINNLWNLFESAISLASNDSEANQSNFITRFDKVLSQPLTKWMTTMELFWIRPQVFLNLDGTNRDYLLSDLSPLKQDVLNISKLKEVPRGVEYLKLIDLFKDYFKKDDVLYRSFAEMSYVAWKAANDPTRGIHYWIYAPGEKARMWEEFCENSIIGIGWDSLGDLSEYSSRKKISEELKKTRKKSGSPINDSLAIWQFVNDLKVGDIVYAKKGLKTVIGRGIIESEYIFDDNRSEFKHVRKIKWTHNGEWEHPGQAASKTLTDITSYTEYVQKLETIFGEVLPPPQPPIYPTEKFLEEVFVTEDTYNTLTGLLRHKKNLILQGAPGVGKTFIARRLAYAMMECKDKSRVAMIQFHQSYSYEDFIMGYRPTDKGGFERIAGPFYEFCKKAQDDKENEYFFIIDEINRGNLSKILGELMMLIETDKRDENESLRLLYSNEQFYVPSNLYIIGLMNTADRSLAMIDYALRRRFAFYEMGPAFDSDGFIQMVDSCDILSFEKVISVIKELNKVIETDDSLGKGFRIGHSYFCADEEVSDDWLKAVINYEIIPLLDEYWFDEKTKVAEWSGKLLRALDD